MFKLTSHAKERMEKYSITEEMIADCLNFPDKIVNSYDGRQVYQKISTGTCLG
jgi:hypothetical protein